MAPFGRDAWVAAGAFGGAVLGAGAHLWRTGSLLDGSGDCPRKGFYTGLLPGINQFREMDLRADRFPLFLPGMSPVLVIPSAIFSIWNAAKPGGQPEPGVKGFFKRCWSQLSSNVVYPSLHASIAGFSTAWLRFKALDGIGRSMGLDISGHAILQTALSINIAQALGAIRENGGPRQRRALSLLAGTIALTDAVWMYNTTAHCHSVGDVATGMALSILAHFGVSYAEHLAKKGYSAVKNRWSKKNPVVDKDERLQSRAEILKALNCESQKKSRGRLEYLDLAISGKARY